MRIAFMGTPGFRRADARRAARGGARGRRGLHAAAAAGRARQGAAALPRPAARRGGRDRGAHAALAASDAEAQAAFAALDLEAAVVAAYGLILPEPILDAPRLGCLNVHASLLPRWRGAAPIQRAILAGDERTGVTIMQMEQGLDTGPMLAVMPTAIGRKTAGELTEELAELGAELMVRGAGPILQTGRVPQPERRRHLCAEDREERGAARFRACAPSVERQIRAFNPAPGACFESGGERIKVLAAELVPAAGDDPGARAGRQPDHRLRRRMRSGRRWCSAPGKAPMTAGALLRGFPIPAGTTLA